MFKDGALLTYYALTPIHMGASSSVSYIDLPIQRERHTSFPMMAASGIKGVFRSFAERKLDKDKVNIIFGPENDGGEYSSCISFTDARILFYPVRSVKNVFAWITCPFVLKRFKEDLRSANRNFNDAVLNFTDDNKIIIGSNNSKLKINNNQVMLEEFVLDVENNNIDNIITNIEEYIPEVETRNSFKERFAIVSDNVFTDLVNYAVEVRTRIRIDQTTGTAASGALFTIEMVPSEAIFYSLLFLSEPKNEKNKTENISKEEKDNKIDPINEINSLFNDNESILLQFGGDESIGLGFVKVKTTFLNFKSN